MTEFLNLDVAEALCLSEAAVRFHLGNIYGKLGVKGKIDLLFLCQEAGFAEAVSLPRFSGHQGLGSMGLPRYVYEIDVATLRELGIDVPEPMVVMRKFNMPGGGLEVVFKEELPAIAIRLWRKQ